MFWATLKAFPGWRGGGIWSFGIGTRCCHISVTIGNFEMKISRNLIQSTFYGFGLFSAIRPTVQCSAKNPNDVVSVQQKIQIKTKCQIFVSVETQEIIVQQKWSQSQISYNVVIYRRFTKYSHITAQVSPYFWLEFCNFATAAPPVLKIFSMAENNMKHKVVIEIPPYYIDTLSSVLHRIVRNWSNIFNP
jgi:hypothetical protein